MFEKKKNIFIFYINIIFFLYQFELVLSSECNYTHPIKKNGECTIGACSSDEYLSGECSIENDLIKTQRITSAIIYSDKGTVYSTLSTTPQGNLVCISSYFQTSTKKFFYGLTENGRPYFTKDNIETPFNEIDIQTQRNEGNVYGIQLNGYDKEYIIAFGSNFAYFELYEFENYNTVYKEVGTTFFGTGFNNFHYASIFKLNSETNYYIISFIAQSYYYQTKTFFIMKFLFNNIDIANNPPTKTYKSLSSGDTLISSCFETGSNYILCFYLDNNNQYIIIAYNQNLDTLGSTQISSTYYSSNTFYKAVHFTGDAGAFLYYDTEKNIAIQFKYYFSGVIYDYISYNPIKITNKYINQTNLCDMVKLKDKKIVVALISSDHYELNLFVIHNYINQKIKIRHYNLKIGNIFNFIISEELNLNIYNDLLSMACSIYDFIDFYSSLIIFSYPNSTDFTIDITDNITSSINPIIKLYEKCNIENNIFGYIFTGVKLNDYTDGLKPRDNYDKEYIEKDAIVSYDTDVELILDNSINIQENERIQYSMVVIEPEYDIYNLYPIEIDKTYCGGEECEDEKDNFVKQWYFGRVSYCDITFNLDILSQDCDDDNCLICNKDTDKSCLICKYLYIEKNGKKKCFGENEIPPTEITTIPTTISTTIPTTILTTIPTTISTTIPITILTTIPTTILTTIPKTNLTTIPKTILTTIPKTILITIPENIITTTPKKESISTTEIILESLDEITTMKTNIIESSINDETSNISTINIKSTIPKEMETTIIQTEETNKNNLINCTNEEIIKNKCSNIKITVNQVSQIKQYLFNNNTKENTIIKTENIIIQLSTVEEQKNSDNSEVSNIDLGDCETILKTTNDIPEDYSLLIFKTDIKSDDLSKTYVSYEIYNPLDLTRLNLSVCNSTQIKISVPISLDNDVELLVISLSESGYNMFNENDSFYNDICSTYTTVNGTDILLSDRKKDIYETNQNQSICQKGCEFQYYNRTSKKVKCDCSVTIETLEELDFDNLFDKKEIAQSFYKTLSNSNFRVLKCFKLVFDFANIKKNIGEILMTVLISIYLILLIIYLINGQNKIQNYINNILKYKKNNNNKNKIKMNTAKIKDKKNENKKLLHQNTINKNSNKKLNKKSSKICKTKSDKILGKYHNINIFNNLKKIKNNKLVKSTKNVLKKFKMKDDPPKKNKFEKKDNNKKK